MSLGNVFRTELTRLNELDFFHRHLTFFQVTGKTVFESDAEYKKWLRGIKPVEPPLINLASDDNDDKEEDAKKGRCAPKSPDSSKRRDVQKEKEKEIMEM